MVILLSANGFSDPFIEWNIGLTINGIAFSPKEGTGIPSKSPTLH